MGKKATKTGQEEPWLEPGKRIAQATGLTIQRIGQYKDQGMPPPVKRGQYNLPATVQWLLGYWKERALAAEQGRTPMDSGSATTPEAGRTHPVVCQEEARRRKWLAEAQLAELNLEQRRGVLLQADEILDTVAPLVSLTRQGFQGFPARVAPRVFGATTLEDVERILREEVRKSLRTIAEAPAKALAGHEGSA